MSTTPPAVTHGAKKLDYPFTVLAVDPLALPLVRFFARKRLLSPDAVSWISLFVGIPVGVAFAQGTRAGLIAGAALWYVSFLFDCIDGKLARALGTTSAKGEMLDRLGDGARRASAVLGLYLYAYEVWGSYRAWWVVMFGIAAFYIIEVSGGESTESTGSERGYKAVLARYRLMPHPGMTDVSALVFVIGPLTGLVWPALIGGLAIEAAAILRVLWRAVR